MAHKVLIISLIVILIPLVLRGIKTIISLIINKLPAIHSIEKDLERRLRRKTKKNQIKTEHQPCWGSLRGPPLSPLGVQGDIRDKPGLPGLSPQKKGQSRLSLFLWRWADSNRRPNKAPESFLHAYSSNGCRLQTAGRRTICSLSPESWRNLGESFRASGLDDTPGSVHNRPKGRRDIRRCRSLGGSD